MTFKTTVKFYSCGNSILVVFFDTNKKVVFRARTGPGQLEVLHQKIHQVLTSMSPNPA